MKKYFLPVKTDCTPLPMQFIYQKLIACQSQVIYEPVFLQVTDLQLIQDENNTKIYFLSFLKQFHGGLILKYRYVQYMSYPDMNILQNFLMPQLSGFKVLQYTSILQVSCLMSVFLTYHLLHKSCQLQQSLCLTSVTSICGLLQLLVKIHQGTCYGLNPLALIY